jgi:hypothetical protein
MSVSRYVAVPLLGFIAVVQALRFAKAWPINVNGFEVPVWASAVAALVFGTVAVLVWREGGSPRR